jgi:hypothetical protein
MTATLGTVSDSTLVTVFNLAPQLIAVTPVNPSITVGQTQHFSATAYFSNGTTQDVTASAHWSSSSANISTITVGRVAAVWQEVEGAVRPRLPPRWSLGEHDADGELKRPARLRLTGVAPNINGGRASSLLISLALSAAPVGVALV